MAKDIPLEILGLGNNKPDVKMGSLLIAPIANPLPSDEWKEPRETRRSLVVILVISVKVSLILLFFSVIHVKNVFRQCTLNESNVHQYQKDL